MYGTTRCCEEDSFAAHLVLRSFLCGPAEPLQSSGTAFARPETSSYPIHSSQEYQAPFLSQESQEGKFSFLFPKFESHSCSVLTPLSQSFLSSFVLNHHDRQHLIIWLVHFFRHFCHPCISIDQPSIRFWTHVLRRRVAEAPKKAQRPSGLDPKHQIILNSWDIISTQSHSSSQSFTPKTLNILDAIAPPSSYPCQPCHQNGWDKIATITENKFEGSNRYRNSLLVMA